MSDPTIEASASDLYESLMKNCYDEANLQTWIQSWIWPLLDHCQGSVSTMRLLKVALKMNSDCVIEEIIKGQNVSFALICLKLDKTKGGKKWAQHFSGFLQKAAAVHFEDSVRIQALDLIISSHSSREDLDINELNLIRDTLELNMVIQQPSDRQNFIVQMKKLSLRLKAAMTISSRKKDHHNNAHYEEFIKGLAKFYFECFFEDASFSRRSIALSCLQDLMTTFPDLLQDFKTLENAVKLVECLHDSYELNKQVALDILETFPMVVDNDDQFVFGRILNLIKSPKPPDSISAGYLTKYLSLSKNHRDLSQFLMNELEAQLGIAKTDLGLASLNGPMYGVLYCLRFLITNPEFEIAAKLFNIGKVIAKVIEPVLNSDSPEGHLPMDIDESSKVSAQLLLLCAWRTSKEISLIFGQLCPFLSHELVLEMSHFFTSQLAEIKHRGAFEQAYIGFCSVCSHMWKTKGFQDIPNELLLATIKEIGTDDEQRLCSTRRSAGIPFLIQGNLP